MSQRARKNGHSEAKNGESKGQSRKRRPSKGPGGAGSSRALQSPLAGEKAPDVIDSLFDVDGELPPFVQRLFRMEFSRHQGLSNYDEADLRYNRYFYRNTVEYVEGSFPPQESLWQGELRKEAGLDDARKALSPEQVQMIRQAGKDAYSFAARSGPKKGMAQQSLLAEQNQQRRVIEEREVDESGGFLSKLIG